MDEPLSPGPSPPLILPSPAKKIRRCSFDPETDELLCRLAGLPKEQQTKLTRELADRLDFSTSLLLCTVLQEKLLSAPLLAVLPENILLSVLKSLDVGTLMSLAKTCRYFYKLVLVDGSQSRELWSAVSNDLPGEGLKWMAASANNMHSLATNDYIDAFRWARALRRNWVLNLSASVVVAIGGSRTITGLEVDWERGRVLMASDDNNVRVYLLNDGHREQVLAGHLGGVWSMQVTGDILLTGSTDRTVSVWDLNNMGRLRELMGHGSTVRALVVHQQYVVSGSRDGVIRVWEWLSGQCVHVLNGHTGSVRCLDILTVGAKAFIVSGSYDESVIIWDLEQGAMFKRLEGHSGRIYSLQVHLGFIYTAGMDHRVKKWSISGQCVADIHTHQSLIGMMECKGRYLVTGSTDGKVCVIDCLLDRLLYTVQLDDTEQTSAVTSVAVNQNYFIATSDKCAHLYDLESGEHINTLIEHAQMVWRVACTEAWCCVAYQQDEETRLYTADFTPLRFIK